MAGPNYTVIPGDLSHLEWVINDLSSRIVDEDTSMSDYILADGSRPYTGTYVYLRGDADTEGSVRLKLESGSLKIQIRGASVWHTQAGWSIE